MFFIINFDEWPIIIYNKYNKFNKKHLQQKEIKSLKLDKKLNK